MGIDANIMPKLITCEEEQKANNSYFQEKQKLLELGIETSSSHQSAIIFRALSDILVAVSQKSGNITLCTASPQKIGELVGNNCVIPRDNSFRYEQDLLNRLQYTTINSYIKKGKFYLIQLVPVRKSSSLFLCNLTGFSPYPDFEGYDVYTLSSFSIWYNQVNAMLAQGMHTVKYGDGSQALCSLYSTNTVGGRMIGALRPLRCTAFVFNVVDSSGMFLQIPAFSLRGIYTHSMSDFEMALRSGVVCIGGKNYTSSRSILERFYGDTFYNFESVGVRQRWALEEALSVPNVSLAHLYKKYKLYPDKGTPYFDTIENFIEYLSNLLDVPSGEDSKSVVARVLINPSLVYQKKVSYYRTIKLDKVPEYKVVNLESVLPSFAVFSAVSKDYGYQVVTHKISVGCDANKECENEFKRMFGSMVQFCDMFNLGESSGTYPIEISLEEQKRLVESLNAGDFVNNFSEYFKILSVILKENGAKFIDVNSVKYLFVNSLAVALKKAGIRNREIKDYSIVSCELWKYVRYCKDTEVEEHKNRIVNTVRSYRNTDTAIKNEIKRVLETGKSTKSEVAPSMWAEVCKSKGYVQITMGELEHSIDVRFRKTEDNNIELSNNYIRHKKDGLEV